MTDILWLDTETFNEKPISHGTYAYTESCEAMILTYGINDQKIGAVDLTTGCLLPADFVDAVTDGKVLITSHNAMFDRNVLTFAMGIETDIKRWRCTMVQAMAHALPGGLDKLCDIFKIDADIAKDKEGKTLINLFCKPRPKNVKSHRRATRETHPVEWAKFIDYAIRDTASMRAVQAKLPKWNYKGEELNLWHFDQKVNDRGFAVDLELAEAALRAVKIEQASLKQQTQDSTGYDEETGEGVESATQRDSMLKHILEAHGVWLPDMKKDTLERRIEDPDLPDAVKDLLRIRLQACTTSTSKYTSLIKAATRGRLRGSIQFDGAGRTRRACLAEGVMVSVLTLNLEILNKPIQQVLLTDKVWDGDNWVAHEGVVYSGMKEIVEHDGVLATNEHIVYLNDSTRVTMAEAKQKGATLWTGNKPTSFIG